MRVLILGGTGFNGSHLTAALLSRGHSVSVFSRKLREVPADVEVLLGDRNGDIDALKHRKWDVVIDTCGYAPRVVSLTAEILRNYVSQYVFISSIAVYDGFEMPGIDEDHDLTRLPESSDELSRETYGGRKVLCEQAVERTYGTCATILRPTYIVGPGDPTDRFTYWPVRVARGGTMLAPGLPSDPIQYIDVRDVADFVTLCVERCIGGRFNLCTPAGAVTMGNLLETSRRLTGSDAIFMWTTIDSLPENERMGGDGDVTIWAPRGGRLVGWPLVSSARAVASGLRFRSLENTVRDTLEWHNSRPSVQRENLRSGMTPERETELLRRFGATPEAQRR